MEFEFKTDILNDSYRVNFSMGHEAFGYWLTSELGSKASDIKKFLSRIEQIKAQENVEQLIEGRDFSVVLSPDEVTVKANSLHIDSELPVGEELSHYDDESFSQCGIDDFESLLHSWLEFVTGN